MEYRNIVFPNYDNSILNTITSILKYYNVDTSHKSSEKLDKILSERKYNNVVLLILDGMGKHILNNISPNGFFSQNVIDTVTSVYPSTTTAALTTYYSGKPPYESGWIAWSQYFKEYGRCLDMLTRNESYLGGRLKKPTIDVYDSVIGYETIFEKIEKTMPHVRAYEVEPEYAERRAKRSIKADNIDEVLMTITDLFDMKGEKFILGYVDKTDKLLHKYGTLSNEIKEELLEIQRKIEEFSMSLSEDTLVIVTADHGHKDISKAYTLLDYPEIQECLIIPASLESRVVTFWVKEDMKEIFEERFNKIFKDEFWLMTKEEFLDKYHFLGYGNKHKKIDDFIGNYIALSVGNSIIRLETYLAEGKPVKKSTHCGLSKEEMEVPVIVIKK